jgi:hypothetical protein
MGRVDEAGFYFQKARKHYDAALSPQKEGASGVLKGEKLLERKQKIEGSLEKPKFEYQFEPPKGIEGWD